ncbi:MAG: IS110 family transposase [Planctomycetaceae bacterium]|nr:IS110 family transposase [Planctomycetaceae bacterium]
MRFYNQAHEFYCGIDLHAKTMHVCVVDHGGKKHVHRNFDTKEPDIFLEVLAPYRKRNLILGCESTFNWYWLADLCAAENLPFLLGHALYLKAIHGGKTKTDRIDSEKLAMLLRGGNFPTSYVYPAGMRDTRDLLRRRIGIVRRRSATIVHLQMVNHQQNHPPFPKSISYKANRASVAERFEGVSLRRMVQLDLDLLNFYDQQIQQLDLFLEQTAKVDDPDTFYRLQSIPGVGRILAMTMLYEIHDIRRFPTVGDFLSYSRLVKGTNSSAGKQYRPTGKRIGNPHLKWAFSEAITLLKRECKPARDFAARIEKRHNKARANTLLAIKLGRAVYWMCRRKTAFDSTVFTK